MSSSSPGPSEQETDDDHSLNDDGPYSNDTMVAWVFRGVAVGVLVLGAANALSFFFRSEGWGSLLGNLQPYDEAIGFPLAVWEESGGYGGHLLNKQAFAINAAFGLGLGLLIGAIAGWKKKTLNRLMNRFAGGGHSDTQLQFSLRGLMITTVLAAVATAAVSSMTPRPAYLAAVYALGPAALVGIAFLPRRISWQRRVAIIIPATVVLIAITITMGNALSVPFDKVMMGVFICWTPQTAIAAILITTWIMLREYRVMTRESVSSA